MAEKKRIRLEKSTVKRLVICLTTLLLAGALLGAAAWLRGRLDSQQAAQRWAYEDTRLAQVSCFIDERAAFSQENVQAFRGVMGNKFRENSMEPPTESARLWMDAFSAEQNVSVSRERTSANAVAVGAGGDFFAFHPLRLRSGYYFAPDDLMEDRVVLDLDLAWKLFGAYDVVDMELYINGVRCIVAAVAENAESWPERETYGENMRVYMSWALFEKMFPDQGITCYEAVLPNPVSGFGLAMVKDNFPLQGAQADFVENSARYSLPNAAKMLADFGKRSMKTSAFAYPYWENAARMTEDWHTLALVLAALILLVPAAMLIGVLARLIRQRKKYYRAIWEFIKKVFDRSKTKLQTKKKEKEVTK